MKRGYVDTPDGQIHYGVEGSGEPVLLLHQTPRSMREYTDVIPLLATKRRVIAMDTMGYGNSDKPPRDYVMSDYAKSVILLLDSLGIEQTSIVGHHTGAYIAVEVAATYPARVEKLVLSGVRASFDDQQRQGFAQTHPLDVKEDGSHLTEQLLFYKRKGAPLTLVNRLILDILQADPKDGHVALSTYHVEHRLPLLKSPTLLIYGSHDLSNWTMTDGDNTRQLIPHSRVTILDGGTTLLLSQMPDQFANLVSTFLDE